MDTFIDFIEEIQKKLTKILWKIEQEQIVWWNMKRNAKKELNDILKNEMIPKWLMLNKNLHLCT